LDCHRVCRVPEHDQKKQLEDRIETKNLPSHCAVAIARLAIVVANAVVELVGTPKRPFADPVSYSPYCEQKNLRRPEFSDLGLMLMAVHMSWTIIERKTPNKKKH